MSFSIERRRNVVIDMLEGYTQTKGYDLRVTQDSFLVCADDILKFIDTRSGKVYTFEAVWRELGPNCYDAFEYIRKKLEDALEPKPRPKVDTVADMFARLTDFEKAGMYGLTGMAIEEGRKNIPAITNVIFNDPATIVFWADKTKTVVKCGERDIYDPEKGLAMAIAKKALGNNREYYNVFIKWLKKFKKANKKKNTRTVIGKVAAIEQTEDGVYARIGLNSTIEAAKLVEAIKKNDPVASFELRCDTTCPE